MPIGIEWLVGSIDLFEAGFGEHALQLLVNHGNARLQGLQGSSACARSGSGGKGAIEVIEHGNKLLDKGFIGKADGILALAGGAFLIIVEIGGGAGPLVIVMAGFFGFTL